MNFSRILILVLLASLAVSTGCLSENEAMSDQAKKTAQMTAEAQRQAGMPNITNYTELKHLNKLYELRDTEGFRTYTYVRDFNGHLHHLCNSIGYGIPYSAQRTTPEMPQVLDPGGSASAAAVYVLPQPEPNGIYPPTSSSATFVLCAAPDGKFAPIYEESKITVSPFPLRAADSYVLDEPPSLK